MKLLPKLLLNILLIVITTNASENTPTQEEVAKLYVATFNRAPDSAGLSYWVNNSGLTLSEIAKSFFVQPETQTLYPAGTTVSAFIQSVYQNLFNRAPDSLGLSYWEDDFNLRGRTRDSFILAMINGAQDTADGMDKTILNNKNEVGLAFANSDLDDIEKARIVMKGVNDDSLSVSFIKNKLYTSSINETTWDTFTGKVTYNLRDVFIKNDYVFLVKISNPNYADVLYSFAKSETQPIQYLNNVEVLPRKITMVTIAYPGEKEESMTRIDYIKSDGRNLKSIYSNGKICTPFNQNDNEQLSINNEIGFTGVGEESCSDGTTSKTYYSLINLNDETILEAISMTYNTNGELLSNTIIKYWLDRESNIVATSMSVTPLSGIQFSSEKTEVSYSEAKYKF